MSVVSPRLSSIKVVVINATAVCNRTPHNTTQQLMKLFVTTVHITEVLCLGTQYETERGQVLYRDYIIYSSCFVETKQKRLNCREIHADHFWLDPTLPSVTNEHREL